MKKICFLILILVYSCAKAPNVTYILDEAYTYPEERNVLIAVPVIPVEIKTIE
jgi:hypothetical protein